MIFNHAPDGYKCPIYLGIQSVESEDTLSKQADLVFKDDLVGVLVNSFWIDTAKEPTKVIDVHRGGDTSNWRGSFLMDTTSGVHFYYCGKTDCYESKENTGDIGGQYSQ